MKQWKRTAAAIFAAAILCGTLPVNTPVQELFSGAVLTAHASATASGTCNDDGTQRLVVTGIYGNRMQEIKSRLK